MTRLRNALQRARDERGYSLIELLTVMVIMSVVMASLTDIFVTGSKAQAEMDTRFRAQQITRLALDRLRRDIHCASAVSPNTPNPWTSAQATVTLTSSTCGTVSYCTSSLGSNRWGLYREPGLSCSTTNGIKIADYLTTSTPFASYSYPATGGFLASLGIDLPISVKGSSLASYRLQDTIFLRNSTRLP